MPFEFGHYFCARILGHEYAPFTQNRSSSTLATKKRQCTAQSCDHNARSYHPQEQSNSSQREPEQDPPDQQSTSAKNESGLREKKERARRNIGIEEGKEMQQC